LVLIVSSLGPIVRKERHISGMVCAFLVVPSNVQTLRIVRYLVRVIVQVPRTRVLVPGICGTNDSSPDDRYFPNFFRHKGVDVNHESLSSRLYTFSTCTVVLVLVPWMTEETSDGILRLGVDY
jgi:hypothetical protein